MASILNGPAHNAVLNGSAHNAQISATVVLFNMVSDDDDFFVAKAQEQIGKAGCIEVSARIISAASIGDDALVIWNLKFVGQLMLSDFRVTL